MKRLAVLIALCVAASTPAFLTPAQAADDPYPAGISTRCTVSVPTTLDRGDRLTVRLAVRANAPSDAAPPRGTLRVRLTRGGDQLWTRQVPYRGGSVQLTGPRLNQPGPYRVSSQFVPRQGALHQSCSGGAGLHVDRDLSPNDNDPDGQDDDQDPQGGGLTDTDGLLPDTGGPNSAWLVLGLLLVGSGGGLVAAARGRREPDYEF